MTARLPGAQAPAQSLIEARDVVKSFGQTPALRGASVAVARGEILAVMGPSDSGKSTLLHCLAGIFTPDRGEIWFAGRTPRMAPMHGSATCRGWCSSGASWDFCCGSAR